MLTRHRHSVDNALRDISAERLTDILFSRRVRLRVGMMLHVTGREPPPALWVG